MKIEFLTAVIPVTDLEQTLHNIAGYIFQQGGCHHTGAVDQKEIVLDRKGYPQHHDGSGAIQRQHGKPQKAAVDKMVLL